MILDVFHTVFSAFVRSRPAHNPVLLLSVCSGTNSARFSVRFQSTGPASINFLHNALLRQNYANHFPESLTWSYLQFSPPASAKDRQHFSLLATAWIIHFQLLTLNQRLATVFPSRSSTPFAIQPTFAPARTASTSSSGTITPTPSRYTLCTSCQHLLQNQSRLAVPFCPVRLHLSTQKFFGCGKQLRSRSIHIAIYGPFPSRTLVYLCHVFSLSPFDFRVVPLFSIANSLMVGTTVIPLNFRWFPPHRQFPVFVHELQCATDGSPLPLRLPPTSRLKKNSLHIFPNTYAWTDLHNCLHVYRKETVFSSAFFHVMNFVKYLTICPRNYASCRINLLF